MTLSVTIKERTNLDLHNELIKKDILEIRTIKKDSNKFQVNEFSFTNE